jgi:hypothetical protein
MGAPLNQGTGCKQGGGYGQALALLHLGSLLLAWPRVSGRVTVPWDAKAHFLPQLQILAARLAKGERPFWSPFIFSGHPKIADPQSLIAGLYRTAEIRVFSASLIVCALYGLGWCTPAIQVFHAVLPGVAYFCRFLASVLAGHSLRRILTATSPAPTPWPRAMMIAVPALAFAAMIWLALQFDNPLEAKP